MLFNENYQYIKLLGEGGFGKVALAKDILADHLVAIKWLKEPDINKQQAIIHEIKTVANLGQPNIVTFYHHFMRQKNICLVMEYCENGSLRDKLNQPVHPSIALPWFEILCETLHYVHLKKIIHHDIKPDNILFTANNDIKISDFGVSNKFAGTLPYMAPELLLHSTSDILDPRTDVFALGVTLLETLTALNPFISKTPAEKENMVIKRDLPIYNLPEWLQDIIYHSLNPIPELRFQTAFEMAEAIKSQFAPAILDTNLIKSGRLAARAEAHLKSKKWRQAFTALNAALTLQPNNLSALRTQGQYYLLQNNITKANICFGRLLQLNPRAEVHKEYGMIQLESGKHREAISLLNDFLQRNPNDIVAHNLIARCFYELGLFEQTSQYLKELIKTFPKCSCFRSNLLLTKALLKETIELKDGHWGLPDDDFDDYNLNILRGDPKCWGNENVQSLQSKFIFREHRFEKTVLKENEIEFEFVKSHKKYSLKKTVIPFGRWGYPLSLFPELNSTSASRMHFVIINTKNDLWLYNLSQQGTFVDGEKVMRKKFLHGLHSLNVGNHEITIKTNADLLL